MLVCSLLYNNYRLTAQAFQESYKMSSKLTETVTAESILNKITNGHLVCQICKDDFKEPRMLECSHSFCLKCLQQLAQNQCPNNQMTCPMCRGQTSLPRKGVSDLRTDFKLISLLDEIKQHKTELKSQQKNQPVSQESLLKCPEHTDKELKLFCYSCDKFICITCLRHNHRMHIIAEPKEILDNLNQKSDKICAVIKTQQDNFDTANQKIARSQQSLDDKFASEIEQISKKADEEVLRIREKERKLKTESKQKYRDITKGMVLAKATNTYALTTSQKNKDEFTRLLKGESSCRNLIHLGKLLQDLKNYTEKKPSNP